MVVWTSDIGGVTNIVGQLYTAAGTEIGQEFTINTSASATWGQPSVAMDAAGDFVVVWSGFGPNSNAQTDPSDIFGRQYNAKGQALTGQFQVDLYQGGTQIPGVQNDPNVAMGPDGTFIVTWASTPIGAAQHEPREHGNLRPGIHVRGRAHRQYVPTGRVRVPDQPHFAKRQRAAGRVDGRQ